MSQTLVGVRIKDQIILPGNGVYVVYAMMEMPIGESDKRFIENLRKSEVLYTRVRATQMYKELDESVRQLDSLRSPE